MLDTLFQGIFDGSITTAVPVPQFLLCVGVSLAVGVFLALVYTYRSQYTRSFLLTLAVLPAVVCVVIMMVNGNIGAGVAVAGAFSLVRFRSVPGTAKEIGAIFLAMATGLVAGMGYLAYAALFALILGAVWVLYERLGLGGRAGSLERTLRVTIPEDLDYTTVFDAPLAEYTTAVQLVNVKTTNLGSLFKITYRIRLKSVDAEKALIDAIRCRNGNLEVSVGRQEGNSGEL